MVMNTFEPEIKGKIFSGMFNSVEIFLRNQPNISNDKYIEIPNGARWTGPAIQNQF